jgi:linoleoyl-CoA desaturase
MERDDMRSSSEPTIKFNSGGAFHRAVEARVRELTCDHGVMQRAYRLMWAKAAFVLLWAVASYIVLVFFADSVAAVIVASLSLGVAASAIGFVIMHDANHHAFARRRSVNRTMSLSLDLIGGSSYVWSAKHLAHHTYPNVSEHDPDIDALPFARFDPAQARRPWHRYQHLYLWLFYLVITMRWQFVSDFSFLRAGRAGRTRLRRPTGSALVSLIGGKLVFLTWAFVIPLALHPVLPALGVFLLTSAVASLLLTTVFQLSHCVEEAEFVDPMNDDRVRTWQVHQVESTVDFAHGNRLLSMYVGGLNHQIEHHLYARLPHTLYGRLAVIVEEEAAAHGISYLHHPTFRRALRAHTAFLKQMGRAEPRPAVAPEAHVARPAPTT